MHERQVLITELDIRFLVAQLAARICYRCKLRYSDHEDADHLFFDSPVDLNYDEAN